ELWVEMVFVAPRIAVSAGELTTIVWVQGVATPKPAIDELHLIDDGLEILGEVFDTHISIQLFRLRVHYIISD
ncbi:MAG: hypothetical protein COS88_02465, partial [Chloroflexi bacterium CG07_land_8_20_14_0_80_51_10]